MSYRNVYLLLILVIFPSQVGSMHYTQPSLQKTVELAIYIDQYALHHWYTLLKRYPSPQTGIPTVSEASLNRFVDLYLETLLSSLNLIYAHPSLASYSSSLHEQVPLVRFHLAHTEVFWKRPYPIQKKSSSWEAAPAYLETFCDFVNRENWNGNRWDHALLLTGVDLKFANGTNNVVAGISWNNSMCNKTYSCSVAEAKTFRSVMTATHELAHSLGIEHDGTKYNYKCPSSTGYIMSHVGGESGKIAWSPCSKNNLKAFLATAPNVLTNQVACLNNQPNYGKGDDYARLNTRKARDSQGKFSYILTTLPGAKFSLGKQCQMGGGVKWKPSRRRIHVEKVCSMLYCNNMESGKLVPFHPALEGTPCAKYRVCYFGECMSRSAVYRMLDKYHK